MFFLFFVWFFRLLRLRFRLVLHLLRFVLRLRFRLVLRLLRFVLRLLRLRFPSFICLVLVFFIFILIFAFALVLFCPFRLAAYIIFLLL